MSMYDLDENKKTDGIKTDANQETNIPSSAKKEVKDGNLWSW